MSKAANLALEIANDLLTEGGSGRKGDHLQIANGVPPNDVYLAGWCESAIVERIAAILEPHLVGEPRRLATREDAERFMRRELSSAQWVGEQLIISFEKESLIHALVEKWEFDMEPPAPPKGEQSA